MIESIQMKELQRHVRHLAVDIGERHIHLPARLQQAGDYIRQTWENQDYQVTPYAYLAKGVESVNYEISLPGESNPEEIILIGAHYDSVPGCPAANDNGSGIAALLELSRCMRHCRPAATVRFVAFVNEEPPFFYWGNMGSMIYARLAKQRGDKIRYMVSLETIGYYSNQSNSQRYPPVIKYFYPNTGNFIAFVSNLRSRAVMHKAVKTFKAESDFPIEHIATLAAVPGVSWSDHLSFWRQGYKAFMVTDTAFYRYPYYHTPMDTYEKLNYPCFTHMCAGLLNMFVRLSQQ
ncbi:M28 family peptidase [Kaarinaea lacus]